MCTLSHDEDERKTTCFSWYKSMKFIKCGLWIALLLFVIMVLSVDVAVTMLSVHPNACDVRLARLNATDMCASHCATMFIRRG